METFTHSKKRSQDTHSVFLQRDVKIPGSRPHIVETELSTRHVKRKSAANMDGASEIQIEIKLTEIKNDRQYRKYASFSIPEWAIQDFIESLKA